MWFFLMLAAAALTAASDTLAKSALRRASNLSVALARFGIASLLLAPLWRFASVPSHPRLFVALLCLVLPIEVAAGYAYQTALRLAPLSVAVPYLALTPLFLLIFGVTFLGEHLRWTGIAGTLLIAWGAFRLHAHGRRDAPEGKESDPQKAVLLMLGVSFAYAVTTTIWKQLIVLTSANFLPSIYYALTTLGFFLVQPRAARGLFSGTISRATLLGLGACEATAIYLQAQAVLLAPMAYVIAVKRLSLLFVVVYGRLFFSERDFLARGTSTALMATGSALILLG